MQNGLVLGKFMPIHKGHIGLIDYASKQCDRLFVWICVSDKEKIPGELRLKWLKNIFAQYPNVEPILFLYKESELPNTSESSRQVSLVWSNIIKENFPKLDVIITSEKYGDYLAEYLDIKHIPYSEKRLTSASLIRSNPFENWQYIPDVVKPYYFKKVCILGTESTGKTTLTELLANYFEADFVSEVGREIVEDSNDCKPGDLALIAKLHAEKILNQVKRLNKILFIDTDISTTKAYSKFLFGQDLEVDDWILKANQCDLYLYLDNDAPFIQDGTRLSEDDRNKLDSFHKAELKELGIKYYLIQGNWDERLQDALNILKSHLI